MPMINEEQKIVQQLAAGNQKVFGELFREHYAYLVSIAYAYTKDYNGSKDLVQEVFFDLWKRRQHIKIETSLRAFLKRAVINQALNANKQQKSKVEISNEVLKLKTGISIDENLEMKELQAKIQSLVDSMPEKCKLVFQLSRFENLSHKEIAAKLNISLKTIENQITKALKIIRKGLRDDHFIF